MFCRIEVAKKPEFSDPGADAILRKVELANHDVRRQIRWARLLDVYWIQIDAPRERLINAITQLFWDPVLTWLITGDLIPSAAGAKGGVLDLLNAAPFRSGKFWGLERRFRSGVTDNVGRTCLEAFEIVLGEKIPEAQASSGSLLLLEGADLQEETISVVARDIFCNELIESWSIRTVDELKQIDRFHPDHVRSELPKVLVRSRADIATYDLEKLSESQLVALSVEKMWALSAAEMKAIRDHFASDRVKAEREKVGLGAPTDVELEVLAQTWSEHCKHKIFNAEIDYNSQDHADLASDIPKKINSLFKETIAGTTQRIKRDWLLSVFSDNAGIVAFDADDALCIKVETHNSPSALDPYGGALTGIVGVNRDILGCGRGARPIFNTDVFCVATPDYSQNLPERILHPRRILDGVRQGVEDGGNKSGIPTVNGALVFDSRYIGKPLIFCGTGGIMPRKSAGYRCEEKKIRPKDLICMIGGRIGKDGIHGATFSSLALDERSPLSAVQLGDPITQKRVADFLFEARDRGLYRTLTDNGAGGLSSSVGELAQITGGARMDVSLAKTKYPGLTPYELVVSESQERMTVAVPPEQHLEFLTLAARRSVEVSTLGEFTESGHFEIFFGERRVAHLSLDFLHEGAPKLLIKATWRSTHPGSGVVALGFEKEAPNRLCELLSRPNIASKEWLIRQYDHEVQGTSVVKPLHTAFSGTKDERSGPNDGAVLKPKYQSWMGVAVGCGLNPKLSDIDPWLMAQSSVDEAVRNLLCVGAEYGTDQSVMALIDNFCWPDPLNDPQKAAELVRACFGMQEAALSLELPFISGKDSMKNDYRGRKDGKEVLISVPPTLLITAMGRLQDVRTARTADFKAAGDLIYVLGGQSLGLLGSELHSMLVERLKERGGNENQVVLPCINENKKPEVAKPNWKEAKKLYQWLGGTIGDRQDQLRAVHDVSDGGVLVAIAEMLIARSLGARIDIPRKQDPWEFAFGEGFHTFVVSVSPAQAPEVEQEWKELDIAFTALGEVTTTESLEVIRTEDKEKKRWSIPVKNLRSAWVKENYWQ